MSEKGANLITVVLLMLAAYFLGRGDGVQECVDTIEERTQEIHDGR